MKLLIAEDTQSLSNALVEIFRRNGDTPTAVADGNAALALLTTNEFDAAVLDIMMPGMDGIAVLRAVRARGNRVPVLLLTARSAIDDKVLGFDSGANDYLTKPFEPKELLLRVRAMTRGGAADDTLTYGNISLDRSSFALSSPSGSFRLANREFRLMELLLSTPEHVFTAQRLLEKLWNDAAQADEAAIRIYISYLSRKLGALHADLTIEQRPDGYALCRKEAAA